MPAGYRAGGSDATLVELVELVELLLLLRVLVLPASEKPRAAVPGLGPGAFRWTGFLALENAAAVVVLLMLVVLEKLEAIVLDR